VLVREELDRLLDGGADEGTNIISALVDIVTRLVVQQPLEGEQADFLCGRGRYRPRVEDQRGRATAMSRRASAPPKEPSAFVSRRCAAPASRSARAS
jgi:hypothetical protein